MEVYGGRWIAATYRLLVEAGFEIAIEPALVAGPVDMLVPSEARGTSRLLRRSKIKRLRSVEHKVGALADPLPLRLDGHAHVAAKYSSRKDPKLTWASRGATPRWTRDEMQAGKLRKKVFLIK
jgi:H-NS histone family